MDERPPIPYDIFDKALKDQLAATKKLGDEELLKITKSLQSESRRNNIVNHNMAAIREIAPNDAAINEVASVCAKHTNRTNQEEQTFGVVKEAIIKSTPEHYKENKAQALTLLNDILAQIKSSRSLTQTQLLASAAYSFAVVADLSPDLIAKVSEVVNDSMKNQQLVEAKAAETQQEVEKEKEKMKKQAKLLLADSVSITDKVTSGKKIDEEDHDKLEQIGSNPYAMAKIDQDEKKHKEEHEKLHRKENKTDKDHSALDQIKKKRIDNAVLKEGVKACAESKEKGHDKSAAVDHANARMAAVRDKFKMQFQAKEIGLKLENIGVNKEKVNSVNQVLVNNTGHKAQKDSEIKK